MKKVRVLLFFSFVVGALVVPPLWSEDPRQTIEDDSLEDTTYGFILNRPSKDWGFLEEKTARRFDADALAGLFHEQSQAYTVVAQEASRQGLKFYLKSMGRKLGLRQARLRSSEIRAAPAAGEDVKLGQVRLSGLKDGEQRSYLVTVVPSGGAYYRVVSWWPGKEESPVRLDLERIHENFTVQTGASVVPRVTADPYEMIGIGWEVRNDFYQNAILGVSASLPRSDWRFMGSQELRELNPQAAMGMEHIDGVYLILVAEKLGEYVWQGYEDSVVEGMKQEIKFWNHETREVKLMNQTRNLHIFERAKVPDAAGNDYGIIVSTAETYGYQWFAWWPAGKQKKALAALEDAYAQFSYMDWRRQKQLRTRLLKFAGRPRSVRESRGFRNHTYRDYDIGLTWKLPPGFWEHRLGPFAEDNRSTGEARDRDDLKLENITNGLYAATHHETCRLRGDAFHKRVLEDEGPHRVLGKRVLRGRYGPIHTTRLRPEDDSDFIYHVASVVRGDVCVRVKLWGYERNLKTTLGYERRVLAGLSVTGRSMARVNDRSREYVDNRMGFAVRKPSGWNLTSMPGAEGRASSFLAAEGPGAGAILGAIQDGLEPRELPGDFGDQELLRGVEWEEPIARRERWLGQDAQLLVFPAVRDGQAVTMELLVTAVGGTNFFVLSVGSARPAIPTGLKNGFRLLR